MADPQVRGGKTGRKIGRNKKKCDQYRGAGRRQKNKAARLRQHLMGHPNDETAGAALGRLNNSRSVSDE